MSKYYPESKVELSGFTAEHYDTLMNVMTLGRYSSLIKKAIRLMKITPSDKILDLGAGTGRNACLMREYLSTEGELVGFDISKEMIDQFKKNCAAFPNVLIKDKRIDQDLGYEAYFDKAFISFVLHGFPQEARRKIIKNVYQTLKKGGEFFILDYHEFSLEEMPFFLRIPFKLIECPYAFDFIERDWQAILGGDGFNHFESHLLFGRYVRLLMGVKAA